MSNFRSLDLDAARAEAEAPDGIKVTFKGKAFELPGELPADVFDPFLSDEFDLAGLIRQIAVLPADTGMTEMLLKVLFERPTLPVETIAAIYRSLELLFGDKQWAEFKAARPSLGDLSRLVRGVFSLYGTSLGEAFASVAESANGGPTSKPTSPTTTPESTPDGSGDDQAPEADSSESAD